MAVNSEISDGNIIDYSSLKERITLASSEESCRKALCFQPRPTDIIIATPPKCGTTWMQQIVHQLRTGGDMDFDTVHEEIPWLEVAHDFGADLEREHKAEPRAYKTHLPYNHVPKGGKYIVVLRNPCSTAYSFYNFFKGTRLPENLPLNECVMKLWLTMGDPPNMKKPWDVSYFTNLLSWVNHRNDPNVLILFFEEMKEDLESVVRAVAFFIGIRDDEKIRTAALMSTFEFMKSNAHKFEGKPPKAKQNPLIKLSKPMKLIRSGSATEGVQVLSDKAKAAIQEGWENEITASIGYQTYEDLRYGLRKECPLKS